VKKTYEIIIIFLFVFIATSVKSQVTEKLNACWWVRNSVDFKFIRLHASEVLVKSKDDCVISLIDKLVDSSAGNNGKKYVQLLSDIRKVSDGYVSEYFTEVGSIIFYRSFDNMVSQLNCKNGVVDKYLEKIIVESIGTEIADAEFKYKEIEKLKKIIAEKKKVSVLKPYQAEYLDLLIIKILQFSEDQ
jgi:hypothetical protein